MNWFKRKPKNRKTGRSFMLDVKLRAEQVRDSRTRIAATALGLIFGTVLGFYLVWRAGEFALNKFIYENNAFALEQIDVQTDGVLSADSLRRWAGVRTGQNLLTIDLARVKRDLELVSVIRSAAVERVLPHNLRLRVSEREPIAEVRTYLPGPDGGIQPANLQLDAEGCLMMPVDTKLRAVPPAQTNDVLTLVTGIDQSKLIIGKPVESEQVLAALRLISAFDRSPMAGIVELRGVDVSLPGVLVVQTGQGSKVTFAMDDPDRQLRRWRMIHDQGQRIAKVVSTLDLSVSNGIPATWIDAGVAPHDTPRTRTFQTNRKKNV
jgi:hypothetical protein